MSIYYDGESSWVMLNVLLEWVKVLAASHIGFRLVSAYERRRRLRVSRDALQLRVRELEQVTEELRGQLQQVLEAERFAVALQLTPRLQERTQGSSECVTTPGMRLT